MGSRSLRRPRCTDCGLQIEFCMCALISAIPTRTRLALVLHYREARKSTNTGLLAARCLSNSEVHVRGLTDAPADLSGLETPERRTLLLFPREDAVPLTAELAAADPRPVTLVVPDGTWGQARRAVRREPALRDAIAVIPPDDGPSRYQLRHEHDERGLATAEAIARALAVLEGDHVRRHIEAAFDEKVARTLETRQPTGPRPWEQRG